MAVDLDLENWNSAAKEYDQYIKKGDALRKLLNESFLTLCGNLQDAHILDAGCGQGSFSHLLTTKGARVIGLDGSERLIHIAKNTYEKEGITFLAHNLKEVLPFAPHSFELITANMVLMDFDPISVAIGEFCRTLKPHGYLVFSILHPIFTSSKLRKTWWEKIRGALPHHELRRYHTQEKKQWRIVGISHTTAIYHRPLEYYAEILHRNGFVIETLHEPVMKHAAVRGENNFLKLCAEIPPFLLVRAKKIN